MSSILSYCSNEEIQFVSFGCVWFPFYVYAVWVTWPLGLEGFNWSHHCLSSMILKFFLGKAVLYLSAKMENIKVVYFNFSKML